MANSGVPVLQPTGEFAYYADPVEVDRLLASKEAFARYSSSRALRALRLKLALPVRAESEVAAYGVQRDGRHLPVIRMRELLAPSPRRNYGSVKAVHHDIRRARPQAVTPGEMRYVRKLDEERRLRESAVHAERIEARRA